MSEEIVFDAQITRIANVGAHKMTKITLEIPQQRAADFIRLFGWATEEQPIPVAIAKMNLQRAGEGEDKRAPTPHDTSAKHIPLGGDPARSIHNPYSRRAGILSADPLFWRFIEAVGEDKATFAASYVRHFCKVISRKDILPGSEAALRFDLLESDFIGWRDQPRFIENETRVQQANKA